MTEIIYLNTHQIIGTYFPQVDRIEISRHYPKNLKEYVLNHEKKHAKYHKRHGLKALPLHIFLDYKTAFSLFANPELTSELKEFNRKSGKPSKKHKIFSIIYALAQSLTVFLVLAGILVGFLRKRKLKDKIDVFIEGVIR